MTRECNKCKEHKPLIEFGKNSQNANGRSNVCKVCKNAYNKEYYGANRLQERTRVRLARYGLTVESYNLLWAEQSGQCKICDCALADLPDYVGRNRPSNACCIDHCHETGKVRGLLCMSCNLLLGYAKDRVSLLDRAKTYLIQLGGVTD